MYKVLITAKAKKELKQIAKKHQEALLLAFEDLKEDPHIGKPLTRELTRRYSYRVGVFRIIYTINRKDKKIDILSAGHRGIVYK